MIYEQSNRFYHEAKQYIPGGVNSPVRDFSSVGRAPIFVKEAKGCTLVDVDDNSYIDYVCSWGPLILGHSSKIASQGIAEAIEKGTTYGLPTVVETDLAKMIVDHIDPIEMVRMVSSGTEATMSALRLARGYTGREKIMKFEGCYHGHSDGLLVKSGSGTLTGGVPTSEGVPDAVVNDTLVAEFNNLNSVKNLISDNLYNIAAIIVEPIPGNMGLVEAARGFLDGLRRLASENGILLIFDEVISGFRIDYGGASAYYGIKPDLICLGKIIGGGMPVGAYGGRRDVMEKVAPLGGVYQAGTLSGNPIAMKMGLNVLKYLWENPSIYDQLTSLAMRLEDGFNLNLDKLGVSSVTINRVGGMLCQFFASGPINSYHQVMTSDRDQYTVYFNCMLDLGVLLPPAQYECMFLSTAHTVDVIERTIQSHYEAMKRVKEQWPYL